MIFINRRGQGRINQQIIRSARSGISWTKYGKRELDGMIAGIRNRETGHQKGEGFIHLGKAGIGVACQQRGKDCLPRIVGGSEPAIIDGKLGPVGGIGGIKGQDIIVVNLTIATYIRFY